MNAKKKLFSASLALVAGAVALVATLGGPAAEEPRRSPLAGLEPGTRRVYALELETRMTTPQGPAAHYKLAGKWVVQATGEPGRVQTFVEGARFASELAAPGEEAKMQAAAAELTAPIELAVDGGGLITEVRENPRATLQARAMLKSIAAYGQFADAPRGAAWTNEEVDGTGTYTAAYTHVGRGRFARVKEAYTALGGASAGLEEEGAKLAVASSRHDFRFAADGRLEELVVRETLGAEGRYVDGLATETTMTLRFVGEEPAQKASLAPADTLEVAGRPRAPGNLDFTREADTQRLAGRSFGEVMNLLEELPLPADRSAEDQRAARVAFIALGASLRLDDQNVAEALELIEGGHPLARTLWDALAQAGTPAAQAALRTVIDMPRWSIGERRSQMIGLSMVQSPTDETVAFMHGKFGDAEQGIQARYGVGVAVYRLEGRRPEAAEKAFRILVDELGREPVVANQAALLVALGNSGYPAALPVVTPYLRHTSPELRLAAVRGVRQQPGAAVDGALVERALDDADESVRLAAVEVLGARPPTSQTVETLARVADEDGASSVRKRAGTVLGELAAKHPELAAQLMRRGQP